MPKDFRNIYEKVLDLQPISKSYMDIELNKVKNEYETTFILNPELSEGEYKEAVKKYVEMIKGKEGKVHNIEHWGMRKLAYPIQKKTNGYYAYLEFTSFPELIDELEQDYRYNESVLRYLTVKLDKHAVAYNHKRREQGFGLRKDLKR
ncbi:MAG: 30S ribosomal protein S6 [Bacteroidota bacterium]